MCAAHSGRGANEKNNESCQQQIQMILYNYIAVSVQMEVDVNSRKQLCKRESQPLVTVHPGKRRKKDTKNYSCIDRRTV